MAPSAEELGEQTETPNGKEEPTDDIDVKLRALSREFRRMRGQDPRAEDEEDGEEEPRNGYQGRRSMQGIGIENGRRENFTSRYFNGDESLPQVIPNGFSSSPKFTSIIDLCRDISSLKLSDKLASKEKEEEKEDKNEEDEFILLYPEEGTTKKTQMGRSSSLKSARTTNGQKKIVRFADVLGLDLADVHTFLDEVPRIPKSAFKDLKNVDVSPVGSPKETKQEKTLNPLFLQPGSQPYFMERLQSSRVSLENAYVTNTLGLCIRGTIRVVNLDFKKEVAVRYSSDKWRSYTDAQATYVDTPPGGFADRFAFSVPIFSLDFGQRLELAVRYSVLGEETWDNNGGANYTFQCVHDGPPKSITSAYVPSSLALENWGSFY